MRRLTVSDIDLPCLFWSDMSTFIITLLSGLASVRFAYPPLVVLLFTFVFSLGTPGTATLVPFHLYTDRIAWGGLLGAAVTSMMTLYQARNTGPGGRFALRVGMVCVLTVLLVVISAGVKVGQSAVGTDWTVCPLVLIITLAYLHDRRTWWGLGFMLVVQLCLSLYVVANPESRMNGVFLTGEEESSHSELANLEDSENAVGTRAPGQFGNTTTMAFHAAVGAGAGLALLIGARRLRIGRMVVIMLAGIGLVTTGVYLLGVSASRGVTMGFAFGILVHFFRARGLVRFSLLVATLLTMILGASHLVDMISEDNPVLGRYVALRDIRGTEEYRLSAMVLAVDAIQRNPVLGTGEYFTGVEACHGLLPHNGPMFLALLYGIPVAVLGCAVLWWAVMSDLTAVSVKKDKASPIFRGLRAFGTITVWTAIFAIFTGSYPAVVLTQIVLGFAMWPLVFRPPVSQATTGHQKC
jgi:hypothetical protein